jgi:hypothetical protein
VEGFTQPEVITKVPLPEGRQPQASWLARLLPEPLQRLLSSGGSDPFFGVVAYRNFKRDDQAPAAAA